MSKSAPDEAAGVLRMLDSPDVLNRKVIRARLSMRPGRNRWPVTPLGYKEGRLDKAARCVCATGWTAGQTGHHWEHAVWGMGRL